MNMPPVFRFAPSPNGLLHLGHACSALLNAQLAAAAGGRFLVRIEDIDATRARLEYEHQILEDLAWLGLTWEEPVMRQSVRLPVYGAALDRLAAMGLTYPCFASRSEIREAAAKKGDGWPHDPDGQPHYPGLWRNAERTDILRRTAEGYPNAVRLKTDAAMASLGYEPDAALTWRTYDLDGRIREAAGRPGDWGDILIARKEIGTSYHLAVTLDDAEQGVTHVVRGADLETSTTVHRLLQQLFKLPEPLYHHHALIRDRTGDKLAKSKRSESLKDLRDRGVTPSQIARLCKSGVSTA